MSADSGWSTIKFWRGRNGSYDMRGENSRQAKLTEENVREIKRAPTEGPDRVSNRALARQFGVSEHAIIRVRKGITWSHVTLDDPDLATDPEATA